MTKELERLNYFDELMNVIDTAKIKEKKEGFDASKARTRLGE
ncbi:MAG TPA: hypothetical protein VEG65_08005 [Candidatus Bathyarchaeia archaeon]|nr:hypothetical protein [Candidatus Bathyarchaeia archaeon]